jgi:outer membrane protein assembly factor BamB/tetratricopeptide (TPR) repeat protein
MTLQGSLQQLGLAGVLQNALAGRSGTLYLRNGTSRAVLVVDEHEIRLLEPDTVDPESLLQGFLHRGLLTQEMFEVAIQTGENPIGVLEHLIDAGAIPRPDLDNVLRAAAEDTILELLTWDDGDFRFQENEVFEQVQPGLVSRVAADMGGILLRAAQRLDERNAIAQGLGTHPHLFQLMEHMPEAENADDPVVEVHALLDGRRVVSEIALLAGVSRFATLKAILKCVQTGCARAATPDELRSAAESRETAGQTRVARDLLMQWAGLDFSATEPLERLAALCHHCGLPDEEADALLTLGHVHLQHGRAEQALPILLQLVKRRPGDTKALTALSTGAEAAGQLDLFAKTVIQLAESALRSGEPDQAAGILTRLVSMPDAPVEAHVLRGRAFVQLRDADRLLAEADAVMRSIGPRATSREQIEAASFFRDSIAALVPERTDLLRQFRALTVGRRPRRRAAILVAFLGVIATAALVLWPPSASSILDDARAAAAAGNRGEVDRLVSLLQDRHPDSEEMSEAYLLQASLQARRTAPRPRQTAEIEDEDLEAAVVSAVTALQNLPSPEATARLEELASLLALPANHRARQAVVDRIEPHLVQKGQLLVRDIRERVDQLGRARDLAGAQERDMEALRHYLEMAEMSFRPEFPDQLYAAAKALDRVIGNLREEEVGRTLRLIQKSADRASRAWSQGMSALDDCHLRYASLDLEEIQRECRTDASRLLVAGRFEEASEMYDKLARRIETIQADEKLHPLLEEIARRRISEFVTDRRQSISEIREGLLSAQAAEAAGDLESAVRAYITVTRKFWHIRFEGVIQLPLSVRTVPAGAQVFLNGELHGTSPAVLHYPWGSQITLTIEAPGYETASRLLTPDDKDPPFLLDLTLEPQRSWSAPLESTVTMSPLGVGGDVLVATRGGRVTLHAKDDGKVRWARHIDTLEGMRARPAVAGGLVYLPHVDGTLWFLDASDGRPLGQLALRRPMGDPAVLEDRVAIAAAEGRLQILLRKKLEVEVPMDGRPTAGVLAAHGAFWVGLSDGIVVRVRPNGSRHRVALPGRRVGIEGMAVYDDGLLVTKGDGTLHAITPQGEVLWTVEAVGDAVDTPAVAAGVAAVMDSRARVLLFDVRDGSPRGQVDLQAAARYGLVSVRGRLLATLPEGRLWIYDPATDTTACDVDLGAQVRFPPALLGDGRIAVPAGEDTFRVVTVPERLPGPTTPPR